MIGAVLGYLFLHPHTMLIYGLYGRLDAGKEWLEAEGLLREVVLSFHPNMLPLGIPFALLGALAGLFLGFWVDTRRQRYELDKRLLVLETPRNLMMTLAHYLLNAAQVVGGFASRDIKKEQDENMRKHLEMIRNEAMRIEAVVRALQSPKPSRAIAF